MVNLIKNYFENHAMNNCDLISEPYAMRGVTRTWTVISLHRIQIASYRNRYHFYIFSLDGGNQDFWLFEIIIYFMTVSAAPKTKDIHQCYTKTNLTITPTNKP